MYFTTVQCMTANNQPHSLCGIELTVIKNNRIYQRKSWLFQPPTAYISRSPLGHASLSLKLLMDAPNLYEIWDEIYPYFNNTLIIFHQLPDNMRALSEALHYYQLSIPHFSFASTMMLAKRLYPSLKNIKLETLCAHLGFGISYEKFGDYSFHMAQAILKISEQLNVYDEELLFTKGGICLGSFQADGICYPDFLTNYTSPIKEQIAPSTIAEPQAIAICSNDITLLAISMFNSASYSNLDQVLLAIPFFMIAS